MEYTVGTVDAQSLIDRAYTLLHEHGISRGSYASDEADRHVEQISMGTKFCAVGALMRAAWEANLGYDSNQYRQAVRRVQRAVSVRTLPLFGRVSITDFNDQLATDADIMALFKQLATPTVLL